MNNRLNFIVDSFLKLKANGVNIKKRKLAMNLFLLLYVSALFYIFYHSVAESGYKELPPIAFFIFFAISIVSFLILRFVYFNISNYIFIGIFFILATYISYKWGVNLPAGLLFYVLIIFISGVLISSRFSFVVGSFSSVVVFIIGYLQISGMAVSSFSLSEKPLEMPDIIIYPVIFGVVSTMSWFVNYKTEKILLGTREYKQELENDFGKKIDALEKKQMKKIEELSRFAEFGRLSSGFFHDLVNPLTAVSLNIERLKNTKIEGAGEVHDCLDRAIIATSNMENLVMAIRKQIAKPGKKEVFYLREEIRHVIQILAYKAQKARIKIDFLFNNDIEKYGSAIKFGQIVTNLLANAIDSYEGSEKILKVEISLLEDGNNIVLKIRDYGRGIKKEIREKIFQPFFTTKENDEGIGIGLFLTKNMVENEFGGKIEVKSKILKGTTFIVVFPKD